MSHHLMEVVLAFAIALELRALWFVVRACWRDL